jgi:formiminotetrahydrofolate cyclodeaminase
LYIDNSIQYYLDELASPKPTPGGGGVAALVGALACGLLSMTANFTLGKEEYRQYEKEVRGILTQTENLRTDFTHLVEEDSLSYQKVSSAYKMPKTTAGEKEKRNSGIQSALKEATLVPLNICKNSFKGINLASDLEGKANINLLDDLKAAPLLFKASFKMASFNMYSNLGRIKDDKFVKENKQLLEDLEKKLCLPNY